MRTRLEVERRIARFILRHVDAPPHEVGIHTPLVLTVGGLCSIVGEALEAAGAVSPSAEAPAPPDPADS